MSGSAVAPYLNLLYLFTLPSSAEQLQGIEKLAENEKLLLKKIFKKDNYDYTQPSDSPTQVLPFMFIDHIEQLDQKQQIMNMHCSVLFHWIDKRIVWEPKDYGNVNRITRPKSDLPRMWFPAVHFTEIKMRSDQAMQYYNTDVTLMSNGAVYAQVSLSVRSTCSFDFSNYPKDEQSCLLTMFTPLPMSRLKFSRWTALTRRSDIFGRDNEGNKVIRSGEFVVTESIAKPLYILPFGKITTNDTADRPEMMRSIVRFEIKFRRVISYYFLSIALPLFCIATISYMAATVINAATSLLWLLMCIAAQILNYTQMLEKLPPDHLHTPLCAKMAAIIFAEAFMLLIFRIAMTYRYMYYVKESSESLVMKRVELGMRIFLAVHCVLNACILFI
ncbi:Acetylcholine receptor-like protein cup-4 [Toxocara canis]|uniref:Acetylcholine receptor-like protein cup-4 n=1 Tax=Toxocara canis TaxID=6265 RepID=A0A0B2VYY3_TOXCA|nr:Acetylcholine receptor-like protein cup-4 [Toxocara canis]